MKSALERDAAPSGRFRHAGVEFRYMLEGRVVYRHGDDLHSRTPGDAMTFDAVAMHEPTGLPARFLPVIVYMQEA